jgi:tRNA (guanosine-2'-O-)-methyltransferase
MKRTPLMRGYFAIGIEHGKTADNLGGLWRCAHAFGAAFMFTVGARYPRQATDTTKAWKHIPLMEYDDMDAFNASIPRECEVIGVDCDNGNPRPLPAFRHPERAIYVLGAEDRGLSAAMLDRVDRLVEIPTDYCLNVATAGGILMYDRTAKAAV